MFKVNDRVWSLRFGWGKIKQIEHTEEFPITVEYKNSDWENYTEDGKVHDCDANRSLFFKEIAIPEDALVRPRWRAKKKEKYFYISNVGITNVGYELLQPIDDNLYNCGNYFETIAEAMASDLYKAYKR
ncbi:MAG: hypothetical protein ACRC6E_05565 [Fusobacteriaceae bacterium]